MSQVMLQGNCPVRWLFEFHNSMLIMRSVMLRHCIEKTTEGSWEQNHVWQLPASQIHRAATLVQVTTWTNPNVWTVFTAGCSCFRGSSGQSLTAAQALSLQTVTREMNKLLFPGSRKQASLLAVFVQLHPFPAYVNINLHVVHCCTHFSSQWKSASQVCFIYNKELWLVMLVHRQLLPFLNWNIFSAASISLFDLPTLFPLTALTFTLRCGWTVIQYALTHTTQDFCQLGEDHICIHIILNVYRLEASYLSFLFQLKLWFAGL